MNKDAKMMIASLRPYIETVKGYICHTQNMFDGDGHVFETAVREL